MRTCLHVYARHGKFILEHLLTKPQIVIGVNVEYAINI